MTKTCGIPSIPYKIKIWNLLHNISRVLTGGEIFNVRRRQLYSRSLTLQVGPQSTKHRLLCLCNHLTSFGGGLLIAPNPIDMDTVFKELSRIDETGNFGVLLTIIFVFCMYLMAIVLAKGADRKDQTKVTTSSKIFKHFFSLSSSSTIISSFESSSDDYTFCILAQF